MQLPIFFVIIDLLLVLGSTLILFLFSKQNKNKLLYFLKILAYVLAVMIVGYFITIYSMFSGVIPRDSLILSIILILIINTLLYGAYTLVINKQGKGIYPILINIIYMSIVIYGVYYFGHI